MPHVGAPSCRWNTNRPLPDGGRCSRADLHRAAAASVGQRSVRVPSARRGADVRHGDAAPRSRLALLSVRARSSFDRPVQSERARDPGPHGRCQQHREDESARRVELLRDVGARSRQGPHVRRAESTRDRSREPAFRLDLDGAGDRSQRGLELDPRRLDHEPDRSSDRLSGSGFSGIPSSRPYRPLDSPG